MDEKFIDLCIKANKFDLDKVAVHYASNNGEDLDKVRSWIPELKKWLVMAAYDNKTDFVIFGVVDGLWHQFVLFTKEYAQFCDELGCGFIHHVPADKIFENETESFLSQETSTFETPHEVIEIRKSQVDKYRNTLNTYRNLFYVSEDELQNPSISRMDWFTSTVNPEHPDYDPTNDPLVNIWARINEVGVVTCPTTSCCGRGGGGCGCIQTRPEE